MNKTIKQIDPSFQSESLIICVNKMYNYTLNVILTDYMY